jgi:gliding motility-associated-like protein
MKHHFPSPICRKVGQWSALAVWLFAHTSVVAQHSITPANPSYTQNFDSFVGTAATLPVNWEWQGLNDYSGFYTIGAGSTYSELIGTYALLTNTNISDRAFGGKFGAETRTLMFTARNETGGNITGFNLFWNVEQYSSCLHSTTVTLEYSIGGGSFIEVPNSSVASSTLPSCGNLPGITSTPVSSEISGISVPINTQIRFRFVFESPQDSNAHIGIDEFILTADMPCTPPTTQANSVVASNVQSNQLTLSWNRGDGNEVLVLAREGSAVNAAPVDEITYSAIPAFGNGSQLGSGNYVVHRGPSTSTTANITNLNANRTYHFAVFEMNTAGPCYLTTGSNNRTSATTPPATITHIGTSPVAANIAEGTINNILYRVDVAPSGGSATLNSLKITTGGTWTGADILNFKLYFSPNSNLSSATQIGVLSSGLTGGSQMLTFSGMSRQIPANVTSYLFVTCDVKDPATTGKTVSAAITGNADFTYASTPLFSGSSFVPASVMTITGSPKIELFNESGTLIPCQTGILVFEEIEPGKFTIQTITIKNAGSVNLDISSILLNNNAPPHFALTGLPPATLAPGESGEQRIICNPQTTGLVSASLVISHNDGRSGNPCRVSVRGAGASNPDPIFPDVVTPNGDGTNDWFDIIFPENAAQKPYVFEVFNRAGGLLNRKEGSALPGKTEIWDGSPCPDGVYFYRLSYDEKVYRGAVTLLGSQF